MSECECQIPNGGLCPRHNVDKCAMWVQLCWTRPDYRQRWDDGKGPGQRRTSEPVPLTKREKRILAELTPKVAAEFDAALADMGLEVTDDEHRKSLWRRWRSAIKRWKKAGKPVRTPEEMQVCLDICKTCEYYDKRIGVFGFCAVCGCNVSAVKVGQLNKIRMATESCPEKKWR